MLNFANQEWPPKADQARMQAYEHGRRLFRGRHKGAFYYLGSASESGSEMQRRKIYLVANYPGLITRASADLLFGEPPKFLVGGAKKEGADRTEIQRALDFLVESNQLPFRLYQSQLACSPKGDTALRVRDCGKKGQVMIEVVPAECYFAELDPDNCQQVLSQAIAWVRVWQGQKYLRVEHHLPGEIHQEAFILADAKVGAPVSLEEIYAPGEAPDVFQETDVSTSLVFHIPNFSETESYYGINDYDDLDSLFEAVNNRMSKIDAYLDKHSGPKLIVPTGHTDPRGDLPVERLDIIEVDRAEDGQVYRMLTWDGNMDAAFKELEHLADCIFKFSEMAPAVFGLDKAGSIESGRAMRMRFVRTQAKINRKRMLYDPQIKAALTAALKLHERRYGGPKLGDDARIDITWQDGIPQDYTEAVAAEAARVTANLTSRQSAIERIDQSTPELAQEELARIRAEKDLGLNAPGGEADAQRPGQQQPGGPAPDPGPPEPPASGG